MVRIFEENDVQDQLMTQMEIERDLRSELSSETDDDKRRDIQLKLDIVTAKIAKLKNDTTKDLTESNIGNRVDTLFGRGTIIKELGNNKYLIALDSSNQHIEADKNKIKIIGEESTYQKKKFLDEDLQVGDQIKGLDDGKFVPMDAEIRKLEGDHALIKNYYTGRVMRVLQSQIVKESTQKIVIKTPIGVTVKDYKSGDPIPAGSEFKIFNASDTKKIDAYVDSLYESTLKEGCMKKKFENMSNAEIASYIFNRPHTKFVGKLKELDEKSISKASKILKRKKLKEEGEITTTANVENPDLPMKLKEKYYVIYTGSDNIDYVNPKDMSIVRDKSGIKPFDSKEKAEKLMNKLNNTDLYKGDPWEIRGYKTDKYKVIKEAYDDEEFYVLRDDRTKLYLQSSSPNGSLTGEIMKAMQYSKLDAAKHVLQNKIIKPTTIIKVTIKSI